MDLNPYEPPRMPSESGRKPGWFAQAAISSGLMVTGIVVGIAVSEPILDFITNRPPDYGYRTEVAFAVGAG